MSFTGDTTNGNATITAITDTSALDVGMLIRGAGIPSGAVIVSIVANTSITLDQNATATATGVTLTAQTIAEGQADLVALPTMPSIAVVVLVTKMALAGLVSSASVVKPAINLVTVKRAEAGLLAHAGATLDLKQIHIRHAGAKMVTSADTGSVDLLQITTQCAIAIFDSSADASCKLVGASDTDGLSFTDLLDEALSLWGISRRCSAPESAINRAINDINGSLQVVWNNAEGRNYFSNDTLTITLADGESSQDLGDDIQNVTGPCRRADNKRPLVPIGTIGELETFADLYGDETSTAEPLGYHIERIGQTGTSDAAKCVFHVTPAVSGDSMDFLLEVVKEAPRYSKYDIENSPTVPLPHAYGESLLLPVIRYKASCYHLFRQQDQKETIDREYQQAALSLGLADPLPGKSGDNMERRSA